MHWGVTSCEPHLIKFRENAVYRVIAPDGRPAALRIHRYGYHSDAALQSELAWMTALGAEGIDVPPVIPTSNNALFATVRVAEIPEPRQVDMLGWLDGNSFGTLESGLNRKIGDVHAAFEWVGQLTARMHNHAEAWTRPPGFIRHAWDLNGLVGEQPLWGRFWELSSLTAPQRSLLERARFCATQDLIAYGQTPSTYGLIHADLLTDNMILGRGRVKVLDFDDSGFGWHLFDLATILLFLRSEDAYDQILKGLIKGYRSVSRSVR